ncbi:hypothetical protein ACFVT2_12605 [Streptomyces sp. NPDC058000]|uniref:hypothetical protein n=1 Tax=Streptomyces sp. NPDC058000 TaxID=3346299 RepID=UPI0036EA5504
MFGDEFGQRAAPRWVGAAARGWAPYGQTLGIQPTYPYLDSQVVRTAFAQAARGQTATVIADPHQLIVMCRRLTGQNPGRRNPQR